MPEATLRRYDAANAKLARQIYRADSEILDRASNLDSDSTAFFARQLEHVKARTYDKRYPELKARALLPVSNEGGPGIDSITYYQYDMFGVAKIIGAYANDLPRADIRGKMFTAPVHEAGDSYGYTLRDIARARFAGLPLEQRKANAALRAIEELVNRIAFFGDADHNLPGFFSQPNVPIEAVANTGVGNTTQWINKTPNQILFDMNECSNGILDNTLGVEVPDTLLLPLRQFNYVASTPRSDMSDTTILDFFLQNNPYVKNVEWLNELTYKASLPGSGASLLGFNEDMMIAYRRDPDKIELRVPQDFEQLPVEPRGLEFIINCHLLIGGCVMAYPLSANFAYGI
ncbi:MAG: DUF2184 domain-containing protein [Cyanobacteria bacterium REEB65]|nr:DUF2184 domain-containing protein [Cyanobacteria bacterium REEB65]